MPDKEPFLRRADQSGFPLLFARLVLGGTFILMGVMKVFHPVEFLKQVRMYEMLPESTGVFLNSAAIVLPWVEIICGVVLILGVYLRGASLLIALMLCVFTAAILVRTLGVMGAEGVSFFSVEFDCGCGAGVVVTYRKMLANVGLFVLALMALLSRSRRFCPLR
jgi:uncharacterized membrane protein YphA (DoxX/SURF4 family)